MRLHLIDGTYELFRSHFSKRPEHLAPDGRDMKATIGVVTTLLNLLHDAKEGVTHIGAAFDNPIVSFRNDLFPGYKSDEGIPPELRGQFDDVEEAVRAIGVTAWSMDEWEADDALATAAHRFADQVEQVRIYTLDKDLGQCVRGKKVVQVKRPFFVPGKPAAPVEEIDEEGIVKLRGIRPASIPDWLALVGDDADGIPGIKGFGEKGAAAVLAAYGSIENIPTYAYEWKVKPRGAEGLATELAANKEAALLYKKLATLVTDVPLKESLDDLCWRGVPKKKFEAWCKKVGAGESLTRRQVRWEE